MSGYSDQFLEQGTTFNVTMTLDDETGAAYNLSNFLVSSQVRRSYYSSNASIVFDAEIKDASNGIISLSSPSTITSNVVPGNYVYDVVLKDPVSNTVTRVLEGRLFVSPGVTR